MIAHGEALSNTLLLQQPRAAHDYWHPHACERLDEVRAEVPRLKISDSSKIVLFSDCHRGDGGRADMFAKNSDLFRSVLRRYHDEGFTYIELGDGDDLWRYGNLGVIRKAHKAVFDLLHEFDREGRLHLVFGNHEIGNSRRKRMDKDGITAHAGLVLEYQGDGTGKNILVTHGHQAALVTGQTGGISRWLVRYVGKHLEAAIGRGLREKPRVSRRRSAIKKSLSRWLMIRKIKVERRILDWASERRQAIICGHTHRPVFAVADDLAYFNTGSCTFPGYITGIEISEGNISLVKWLAGAPRPNGQSLIARRQLMAAPLRLSLMS